MLSYSVVAHTNSSSYPYSTLARRLRPTGRSGFLFGLASRASAFVVCAAACLLSLAGSAVAQQPISDEGFRALAFQLEYKRKPLVATVISKVDSARFTQEKVVIDGWRGSRVPLLLAVPRDGQTKHPVVILIDGMGGSKDRWWQIDSWNGGRAVIDSLLNSGFAVVMADAPFSGERIAELDYQDILSHVFSADELRDLVQLVTIEHRRIIDYLASRSDIDSARIGALGLSLGGMITFYLAAVEPRLRAGVTGVTPLRGLPEHLWPGHFAPRSHIPLLMLMGRADGLYDTAVTERVLASISTPKKLVWYDAGHRLPAEYAGEAARWLRAHLE